mgnify:FL=1
MRNSLIRRPNSLLEDFFNDDFFYPRTLGSHLDVYQENDNYVVEADLPGFKKEEIELQYENDLLTIRAQHKEESNEENKKYVYRSRSMASYVKQIRFTNIDPSKIDAKFDDGVLKVTLPSRDHILEETKRIEVK